MGYSSEVQQQLRIELPAEALERLKCRGDRHLGIDIHRHIDLRMPEDSRGEHEGVVTGRQRPK